MNHTLAKKSSRVSDPSELSAWIAPRVQASGVPALSAALIEHGRVAWAGAFGVKHAEGRQPATRSTVFEAASLSKPVVAYATLRVCAHGLMSLDAPLADYLPLSTPFIPTEPRLRLITARTILSHTSGLQHWLWDAGDQPALQTTPGAHFSYSSLGFVYLQQALEQVCAEPLAATVQREVFDPLEMRHSSMTWRDDYETDAASGHNEDGVPVEKWKPVQAMACASLHTTALDYARFMLQMMSPNDVLAARMLRRQVRVNTDITWGLGWALEQQAHGGDAFWHWGDNGAFKAFCIGWPTAQRGAVAFANSAHGLVLCEDVVMHATGAGQPNAHGACAWVDAFYR
jgi:CubicO group peptidase (beta-lactamase class C family)